MQLPWWRNLKSSRTSGVALAVDFGHSRPEAGFDELAKLVEAPVSILETAPGQDGRFLSTVEEQVRRWSEVASSPNTTVLAVMGYCAGSALAEALAEEVGARTGEPPPVVLFDPEVADSQSIGYQFRLSLASFRGAVDDSVLDDAAIRAEKALTGFQHDEHVPHELVELYRVVVSDYFEEAGLGAEMAGELVARFAACIRYLVLASHVRQTERPACTLVTSAAPGAYRCAVREQHVVAVPRAALLSSRPVGELMSAFLSRAGAQGN